jgi:tRNA(fMet)-specific endonuclease VapC
VILDTNAVSALFVGDRELAAILAGVSRHHLPSVVVGEYRFGLMRSRHRESLSALLAALVESSVSLAVDMVTAGHYAAVRETLRSQGSPIPENDVWIAALARQHALPIASRDEHFDLVPGIERRSW